MRDIRKALIGAVAAGLAFTLASGALATDTTPEEDFYRCLEFSDGGNVAREACCAEAGGSWVEIYDSEGNVTDTFCDGVNDISPNSPAGFTSADPSPSLTVNPALVGNTPTLVQADAGTGSTEPTPTAASQSDEASSGEVEAASAPAPTPTPAPVEVKRKHRRHHRHHR
jgi:hypothetical protein